MGSFVYAAMSDEGVTTRYYNSWIACNEDDAACTVIVGACHEWMPVNVSSIEPARAYYDDLAKRIRCVTSPLNELSTQPPAYCAHTECVIGLKPAQ